MILTKWYYKKRQNSVLATCIICATIIGSIQTWFIINNCKNKDAQN